MTEPRQIAVVRSGVCAGGPHDGDLAECEGDYFNVILKQYPDVTNADGTVSRRIDYETYYWADGFWRWGTNA